jgi:acyl-ACP thioesterase
LKNTLEQKHTLLISTPYSHIAAQMFDYLIFTAGEHAANLGVSIESLLSNNFTWMLSYLNCEFYLMPESGDDIYIETWPSGINRLFSCRDFLLKDKYRNIIAKASTGWLVVDLLKRRPVRLPQSVKSIQAEVPTEEVSFKNNENINFEYSDLEEEIKVLKKDIDINNHVTTVSYADWIFKSCKKKTAGKTLKGFYIDFKAEAFLNEEMYSYARYKTENSMMCANHSLQNKKNSKEHCSAYSIWQ